MPGNKVVILKGEYDESTTDARSGGGRQPRGRWSLKMQQIAIQKIYSRMWNEYHVYEIDKLPGELAKTMDIGGIDKLLQGDDGHLILIGQRFRKAEYWYRNYRDFTIRESEYNRHLSAIEKGGFVPGYYVCGFATDKEDDFIKLMIFRYRTMMIDVSKSLFVFGFKETRPGQENFYYVALSKVPKKYVKTEYPFVPVQQGFAL